MKHFDNESETGGKGQAHQEMPIAGRPTEAMQALPPTPNLDMLAKGIVVGVTVSIITHTGKQVVGSLMKNPVVAFGIGFAVGFMAHRHRKQIIAIADNAAQQSKAFALRQKATIEGLLGDDTEEA